MIPRLDNWGIVLAGHWNRMIFTPDWVGSRLFKQEEVETQIVIMPIFPILYRNEHVILEVSAGRVIFRPRFDANASLEAAEQMALTVLEDLPNTPLIGVGVNLSYSENTPPRDLLEVFNILRREEDSWGGVGSDRRGSDSEIDGKRRRDVADSGSGC